MIGSIRGSTKRPKDEAEKPFWISYADLMTAMMVLFLVVMSFAMLSVTKKIAEDQSGQQQLDKDIAEVMRGFADAAALFPGIKVDASRHVIDFGSQALFAFKKSTLTLEQERLLRRFAPEILRRANTDLGRRVLKRIVIEGFTDTTGTYLGNLSLSLERSERVLCALLDASTAGEVPLTKEEKQQIRDLFLVGGYSYNAGKATSEESRRVEMRLEFLSLGEKRPEAAPGTGADLGVCALAK